MKTRVLLAWPPRAHSPESLVDALSTSIALLEPLGFQWWFRDERTGKEMPMSAGGNRCASVLERSQTPRHRAGATGAGFSMRFAAKKGGRPRATIRVALRGASDSRAAGESSVPSASMPSTWAPNEIELVHFGRPRVSSGALRACFRGLVETWGPLWAFCATDTYPGPGRQDGAPRIGWLTFLSRVYGVLPHELDASVVEDLGSIIDAQCSGRFDPGVPEHLMAVERIVTDLELAGLIQPYAELRDRGLAARGKLWVVGPPLPPPAPPKGEDAAPVVVVQQASYMRQQPLASPQASPLREAPRPADPLEPLAALGTTSAASKPRSEPVLPFAASSEPSPLAQTPSSAAPKPRRGAGLEPNASFGETAAASKEAPKAALPFQSGQGSAAAAASSPAAAAAPSTAAPKPRRGIGLEPNASFGETAAVSREAPKAALPFGSRAETASAPVPAAASTPSVSAASGAGPASAPAAPGARTPTDLSLDQYAMLCAEYAVRPEDRAAIRARYGISGEAEREAIGERWAERLRGDPEREAAFRARVQQLVEWLRAQGRR